MKRHSIKNRIMFYWLFNLFFFSFVYAEQGTHAQLSFKQAFEQKIVPGLHNLKTRIKSIDLEPLKATFLFLPRAYNKFKEASVAYNTCSHDKCADQSTALINTNKQLGQLSMASGKLIRELVQNEYMRAEHDYAYCVTRECSQAKQTYETALKDYSLKTLAVIGALGTIGFVGLVYGPRIKKELGKTIKKKKLTKIQQEKLAQANKEVDLFMDQFPHIKDTAHARNLLTRVFLIPEALRKGDTVLEGGLGHNVAKIFYGDIDPYAFKEVEVSDEHGNVIKKRMPIGITNQQWKEFQWLVKSGLFSTEQSLQNLKIRMDKDANIKVDAPQGFDPTQGATYPKVPNQEPFLEEEGLA